MAKAKQAKQATIQNKAYLDVLTCIKFVDSIETNDNRAIKTYMVVRKQLRAILDAADSGDTKPLEDWASNPIWQSYLADSKGSYQDVHSDSEEEEEDY